MKRLLIATVFVSATVFALTSAGCNTAQSPSNSSTEKDGEHDHGEGSGMEEMKAGLAELSDADRESAEKQHVCPVSGEMLGTMGTPIEVDVQGQQVWICCEGCRKNLLNNSDRYLAKMNQK